MPMQTGYAVTIKGFVRVDPSDLDAHARAIAAVQAAKDRNVAPLFELMALEHIDVRPKTRHAPEPKADIGGFASERGPEGPRE